jgi:hypothetical protein
MENKDKNMNVVTMLCDSALRYQSKIFNESFLAEKKLSIKDLSDFSLS